MPITAKDLTQEFPRSPYDTLDGIPWLPRLIDKVRALGAGRLGAYTPYPCGGDKSFLAATGLDTDALKAQIDAGKSDAEIVTWVRTQLPADAAERIEAYRRRSFAAVEGEYATYLAGAKAELASQRPDLDLSGVDNFARLICAEEGYAVPQA